MESIATNLGKPERRTLNGRSYLVAPATLIVSGRVLEGNQGPGLYPAEEVEAKPHIWNKMPLVLWHPKDELGYVTARDPEVIASQGIGDVYSAQVTEGKLVVQAWFDEALVKLRDEQYKLGKNAVLPRLLRGEPIELSTGLFPKYDRTPGVAANGDAYEWVARDIDADHVAILPDEVGACSNEDGCGVNNHRTMFKRIGDQLAALARMCWGDPCPEGGGAEGTHEGGGGGGVEAGGGPSGGKHSVESVKAGEESAISELKAIRDKHGYGQPGKAQTDKQERQMVKELSAKAKEHADKFRGVEGIKAVKEAARKAADRIGSFVRVHNEASGELGLSPEKCRQILEDGTVGGQPLTDDQRGMFGACAGSDNAYTIPQGKAVKALKGTGNMATKFDRKKAVEAVRNCSCLGKAWPLEALNKLSDDQLRPLAENARMLIVVNSARGPRVTNDVVPAWPKLSANQRRTAVKLCDVRRLAANQDEEMEAAGVDIAGLAEFLGIAADPASDPVGFVNELKGKLDEISAKLGIAAPPPAPEPEPEASSLNEEEEKKDEEPATYSRGKAPVAQPVKNRLTPEEQEDLAYARFHRRKARAAMVDRLAANAKDPARAAKVYDRMTDRQLQELVDQLPAQAANRGAEDGGDDRPSFFFGGNGGGSFEGSSLAGNRRRGLDDEPTEDETAVVNMMTPQRPQWGKKREKAS